MYEIEAKVKIDKKDLPKLRREILQFSKKKGSITKNDYYYGNVIKDYLRIRKEGKTANITIKLQERKKGIEINQEIQIPITSVKKMQNLFSKFDIPFLIHKNKKSEIFQKRDISIEINHVASLGYFLEIEILTKTKTGVKEAQKKLNIIFKKLGFSSADYVKKSYPQLLVEKRRRK